jgi:hypothetical protein
MSKLDPENIAHLAVILSKYTTGRSPNGIALDALTLAQIGRALHRLAEIECNGELTRKQRVRQANLLGQAITVLLAYRGVSVQASGDPRGYCLRLKFPHGEQNNWAGDFGV